MLDIICSGCGKVIGEGSFYTEDKLYITEMALYCDNCINELLDDEPLELPDDLETDGWEL